MLDSATKQRIDTARNMLVGKIPSPQGQVEQITIALIYKFMDDMDAGAEELGGKRKFFAGKFAQYGWAKLMRAGLGGHEVLNLYAEAIQKMSENPGIPPLFRGIFKNAYLPYRDPETLKGFLKIIDEFTYDHSERLGDAFEYLLSVLGSQGDAGQFRTPRHIIDFIVEIVDPKKNEVILDPACGTAGFLISAFKHIQNANKDAKGKNTLTPTEKGKLAQNLKGYDISPDMVRLSLVNLYLHGFPEPHIYEYDSLTSQERWNEFADVILANPPFMSPKGGIKPHNHFSVQSKRSEVLFVDYMAEHLTPNGRAGIIVPEGIIFQSQSAYVQLRKMLVEESLVAVISLPAGCFNPYSGVKTSILILDKSAAKQSNALAFFKVENDGFGLGAQRKPIEKNDLPKVKAELGEYLGRLRAGRSLDGFSPASGLVVSKEKVAANGEFNLSVERYRENILKSSSWPFIPVGKIFHKSEKSVLPESLNGSVIYVGLENLSQDTGEIIGDFVTENPADIKSLKNVFHRNDILYGKLRPNLNKVWLADRNGICSTDIFVLNATERAIPALYAYLFRTKQFNDAVISQLKGAQLPRVGWASFAELKIPVPSLDAQKEILAEIEGYQKVIDGARAVVENYRPRIAVQPDWPIVALGELTKPEYGYTEKASDQGDARFIRITDISEDGTLRKENPKFITVTKEAREYTLEKNDILVARTGATYGKTMLFEEDYPAVFASFLIRLRFLPTRVHPRYYWIYAQSDAYWNQAKSLMTGGGQPQFNGNALVQIKIPLPPVEIQQKIVADVEAQQILIKVNHELISNFERKIRTALSRVWGEDVDQDIHRASPNIPAIFILPLLGEVEDKAHFKRIFLATYIINQSLDDPHFGDTKFEKLLYLSEYHCLKRNFDQHYYKQAAGPYDNKFTHALFSQLENKAKWFTRTKKGNQFVFRPGVNHQKSKQNYNYFSEEEISKVDQLISLFKVWKYNAAEIVSTFHAVWNNRIIKGEPITDDLLIADFYAWDEQKKQFREDSLRRALPWMRENGIVPDGWGRLIERAKSKAKGK